jgi:hypothetical protein
MLLPQAMLLFICELERKVDEEAFEHGLELICCNEGDQVRDESVVICIRIEGISHTLERLQVSASLFERFVSVCSRDMRTVLVYVLNENQIFVNPRNTVCTLCRTPTLPVENPG